MSPALWNRDFACEKDSPTTFGTGGRDADLVVVTARGGTGDVVEVVREVLETIGAVVEVFDAAVALGTVMAVEGGAAECLGAGGCEVGRGSGLGVAWPLGEADDEVDDDTPVCAWDV